MLLQVADVEAFEVFLLNGRDGLAEVLDDASRLQSTSFDPCDGFLAVDELRLNGLVTTICIVKFARISLVNRVIELIL